jgi:hypothetical protein
MAALPFMLEVFIVVAGIAIVPRRSELRTCRPPGPTMSAFSGRFGAITDIGSERLKRRF